MGTMAIDIMTYFENERYDLEDCSSETPEKDGTEFPAVEGVAMTAIPTSPAQVPRHVPGQSEGS